MAGQSFSFPPPPPPPRRSIDNHDTISRGRGYNTRAQDRGGFHRGRAYGQFPGHGRGRGAQYGHSQQRTPSHDPRSQGSITTQRGSQSWNTSAQQKRDHSTAFAADASRNSIPPAAPAVPCFSANLANLLPPKPVAQSAANPVCRDSPRNALGLTPVTVDQSDSEDDEEEESKLVQGGGQDLQFSYRGQTAALRTPAEIAAWIAERKRRYPTQAKREAAQKEAEERRKRWEAEKRTRVEATRRARENRPQKIKHADAATSDRTKSRTPPAKDDHTLAAKLHAERLRRKALKAQRDLAAAEAQLEKHMSASSPVEEDNAEESSDDSLGTLSESSAVSSDDSCSSSESGTDNGGPPEAQSSKVEVPNTFNHTEPGPRASRKPCVSFFKTGRCRFGSRCHFSHERTERAASATQTQSKRERKGLFQVMVAKEQDEELRKVLTAIIALGKQGVIESR